MPAWVWLVSRGTLSSSSIRVSNGGIAFLDDNILNRITFLYSSVDGHLGCGRISAPVNGAAVSLGGRRLARQCQL